MFHRTITLLFVVLVCAAAPLTLEAQDFRQTIRGRVYDSQSQEPLEGAVVQLVDSALKVGALSDADGRFVLSGVPVGRRTIQISFIGYAPRLFSQLMVTSGKEVILDVGMEEDIRTTEAVEITATQDKRQSANDMSTVSSRVFSLEETNRYAGSLNDPSRMAANFAGVVTAGDSRNDIVIRGNAPSGLLWRLEGVDIPNPNHFSTQGANGGPIGILNNNMLANSDFMTGAFPAEYSNATSGAFDLKLRSGNSTKRETMFQIGFNGLELMTEGPFSNGSDASYLVSYRYSTLAVFDALGISFGDLLGIPYFQDLSFKVNLPKTAIGSVSVFGVGGYSTIDILESELTDKAWNEAAYLAFQDVRAKGGRGVVGMTHSIRTGERSFIRSTIAVSHEQRGLDVDSVAPSRSTLPEYDESVHNFRYTLTTQWVSKLSSRHSIRIGGFADVFDFKLKDELWIASSESYRQLRDISGSTALFRPYAMWQWRLGPKLTLNSGVNGMLLALNDRAAVEPRAGIKWQLLEKHALSIAYGMHHQMQPFEIYFLQDQSGFNPNKNLDFTRSQHLVAGYDWTPWANFRLKFEAYYQTLDRVPVDPAPSSFSMLNVGANFDRLPDVYGAVNRGTGENYGVELTLEKFLSRNYYFLVTASFFESTYEGSDGRRHSTAFNQQYVLNALAGAEFWLDPLKKKQVFFDLRLASAGGMRYTPVDYQASLEAGQTVRMNDQAFSEQARSYFRLDLKAGIRLNHKKFSHEFAANIQNVTDYDNILALEYDLRTNRVIERYQLGFFPVVQYKINF